MQIPRSNRVEKWSRIICLNCGWTSDLVSNVIWAVCCRSRNLITVTGQLDRVLIVCQERRHIEGLGCIGMSV